MRLGARPALHLCKTGKLHKGTWNLVRSCGLQHKHMAFSPLLRNIAWANQAGKDHSEVLQCC